MFALGVPRPLGLFRKTSLCVAYSSGECSLGVNCKYAHGEKELRKKPAFCKTRLCCDWQKGQCYHGECCKYAHGSEDLRARPVREGQQALPQLLVGDFDMGYLYSLDPRPLAADISKDFIVSGKSHGTRQWRELETSIVSTRRQGYPRPRGTFSAPHTGPFTDPFTDEISIALILQVKSHGTHRWHDLGTSILSTRRQGYPRPRDTFSMHRLGLH